MSEVTTKNDLNIAVLVDVQNIYYTTRQAYGRAFNYRKLWQELQTLGDIRIANAYAIKSQNDSQIKFQDALKHIGFNVKLKPFIQRSDGSAKGDWDVGITIDALEIAHQQATARPATATAIDTVVLLSGDGDFELLIEALQNNYQLNTHVYGVPNLTAENLKASANHYYPITESLLL